MQLFSRKKALVALSLGALTALGACGDDVTVPVAPDAPVVISITPPNATMNIGESLNFAVQITGGNASTPPTLSSCTSSNPAVATAAVNAGACRVAALTSGNVTITAKASTGGEAAAVVTVSPAAAAITNLTVSPTTATLGVGQKLQIVPNVTKAATSVTVTTTYAPTNAAIASVNATTGEVTAVAPGTTTITVTSVGTGGASYTNTTLTAGVTITVTAAPSALTSLTVQPQSLSMAVSDTAQLTANVTQPVGAPTAVVRYRSLSPAIATVDSATGKVTAVSQGTSSIEVKATAAGTATLAAATLIELVPITVAPPANATVVAILQGPTVTTTIDSTYSGVPLGTPSATPIGSQNGVIAGIRFSANGQLDQSVDILNVKDQIQVDVGLEPNGQRISALRVYLCPIGQGAPGAVCGDTIAAAIQTFANNIANPGNIRVRINTAEFTVDTVAGTATVRHPNGRYVVRVQVLNAAGQVVTTSTDERSILNFNNIDNFALDHREPKNKANDSNSRTWWGGPTTPDDALLPDESGRGTFRIYPVIYTPGRQIKVVEGAFGRCLGITAAGLPGAVADTTAPFDFSYGTAASGTTHRHITCTNTGAYDAADQFRFEDFPMVLASLDNSNNPGPRNIYAYNPSYNADPFGGPRPTLFRFGTLQPVAQQAAIRVDYAAPALTIDVPGPSTERWVNGTWSFKTNYVATDDGSSFTGVGLFADRRTAGFRTASKNPCLGPNAFGTGLGTLLSGGYNATVLSMPAVSVTPTGLQEHPCDFTNNAYAIQATETDLLGNRATTPSAFAAAKLFGVDQQAPIVEVGNAGAARAFGGNTPNFYAISTSDSIFQPARAGATTPVPASPVAGIAFGAAATNPTDWHFGVRYRDERSGFNIDNHGTRTVKAWRASSTPLLTNAAQISTVSSRTMNFNASAGNPVESEDPTWRRDSVWVYGHGPLAGTLNTDALPSQPEPLAGYYRYDLQLYDRAGNTTATISQKAVLDATSPIVTGVNLPAVFGANGTSVAVKQAVYPTGNDDLDAFDSDVFLRYPAMALEGDLTAGTSVSANAARIRFRRDRFQNWTTPWSVYDSTLLATPFGPGAFVSDRVLGPGQLLPIASIRGIEPVDLTDAPVAWGADAVANPFVDFKPNAIGIYAFDIRAHQKNLATTATFQNLGMINNRPGFEAAYVDSIFQNNVANGSRWDVRDLDGVAPGVDRLVSWSVFGGSTASLIEVRAVTSTMVTRAPFPTVHLVRWEADVHHVGTSGPAVTGVQTGLVDSVAGQWVYVGSLTASAPSNPLINDQGSSRFWRYQFAAGSYPAITTGRIVQPGVTNGCYRAIGVDDSGDGVTTRSFTVGAATCPVIVPQAGATATITRRSYGNGAGTINGGLINLTKTTSTEVQRRSALEPNAGALVLTITPSVGSQLQSMPTGCTGTSAATYPTTAAVTCTIAAGFGPRTVTAIFEQNP